MTVVDNDLRRDNHVIAGAARPSPTTFSRTSLATGIAVAEYAKGTPEDAHAVIAAARAAFDSGPWPARSGLERRDHLLALADAMQANHDRFVELEIEETGKPIRLARGDVDGAIGVTRYAAGLAVGLHGDAYTNLGTAMRGCVVREPAGVAGLIVPWNFPTLILCHKLPFALAAGCTAVVKPSEYTPGGAVLVAELAADVGIPDGVVNVVTGYGDVGAILAKSPNVDVLSFTGSTATGQKVMTAAAGKVKKISLELGGKAANVVFADADLDDATDGVLFGILLSQGECCCSGTHLLVEDSIADEFVSHLTDAASRVVVDNPYREDTDIGALIHDGHVDRVMGYVKLGQAEGAELLTGGNTIEGPEGSCFLAATIFDHVSEDMSIFKEEIFGSVLTVTRFSSDEEAVRLVNNTPYGLANILWTKDIDRALTTARRLRSGSVWINTTIAGPPQLPFGGYKGSGSGREIGEAGLEEFTEIKTIAIGTGKRHAFFTS